MASGVPTTVATALADHRVEGRRCLDAGTGVGNSAAGLARAAADRVITVTTNPDHAHHASRRFAADDRVDVIRADLRSLPLGDDSVEFIMAHAVCNVLEPSALALVATEWYRIAAPDCVLVIDDYDPIPEEACVSSLFELENAAAILATGRPALTFYPAPFLVHSFVGAGWELCRMQTLLDPVPWTAAHLDAHTEATAAALQTLSPALRRPLTERLDILTKNLDPAATGRMYSLAFRLPAVERGQSRRLSSMNDQSNS